MKTIDLAIKNLENISLVLEKTANSQENYNSEYSRYLENISYEMRRHANDLREVCHFIEDTYTECKCANGCMKCLGMSWRDFY